MNKIAVSKPLLIMMYGYPGAGKTFFARQLCEQLQAVHVQGDRIRYELFDEPQYDKQENEIVTHLVDYMTEEFLKVGVSVIYDINAMRLSLLAATAEKLTTSIP
ncbi:MAG: AAA family ATPase [Candidatus Saccharimonadales bacterium]